MEMMHKFCHKKSLGIFILRLFVGIIFIIHGVQKFENIDAMVAFFGQLGLISAYWVYLVATVETVGGAALVLGLFTRYAAILLSIIMVVAIAKFKWVIGGDTWLGKFAAAEIDIALLGANLALLFTGAGKMSVSKFCKCHKDGKGCKVCKVMGCESCGGHKECCEGTCDSKKE